MSSGKATRKGGKDFAGKIIRRLPNRVVPPRPDHKKALRKVCATEHHEQCSLIEWADNPLTRKFLPDIEMLYAIPNGGHRSKVTAAMLKAEGVRSGVLDLNLDTARGEYHGLRIEMKRREGGRLSDEQEEWIERYTRQGYRAVVCEGWEEARDEIVRYLKS